MGGTKAWPMLKGAVATLLFLGTLLDGVGIGVARADNPFVQTIYTADPAPHGI